MNPRPAPSRPAAALCGALAAALAAPAAAAEQRYSLTDFDRIQVEGPYQVTLVTGLPTTARATGSTQAIERVTVEVQGRTLRIHPNRSAWGGYPGAPVGLVRIAAATHDLASAAVAGSGSLNIDKVRGPRLDLNLVGNGRLSVGRIDADTLNVAMFGSGEMRLAGKVKQMRATVQGTGDLKAADLSADDAQLNAETAGSVALAVTRSVHGASSGAGDVVIGGRPACAIDNKGAGQVRCGVP